jgi:transcriptional regulator with XRE-family HTH domain
LRREEVALLANISTDFYARLEQRRGARPSEQTVDGMARALRLTHDERDHLFRLAGHKAPPRIYRSEVPSPGLVRVLEHLDAPAQIVSDLGVTLRQNRLAQAIRGVQTGRTGLERSMIYRWFTSAEERRRIPVEDHEALSRRFAAHVRAIHSRSTEDWEARTLVDELYRRSREFADLWDQHEVALIVNAPKRVRHPAAGVISLDAQVLTLHYQTEVLIVFSTAPDSEDAERLAFLASVVSKGGPLR